MDLLVSFILLVAAEAEYMGEFLYLEQLQLLEVEVLVSL
jgi:hypothetical protein